MKHQEGLAKIFQQMVGGILHKMIDPEEFGLVTVPHVNITKDFDYADVYVSTLQNKDELKHFLRANVYKVQQEVNKKIQRKTVPKIRFFVDYTGEHATWVEEQLAK